ARREVVGAGRGARRVGRVIGHGSSPAPSAAVLSILSGDRAAILDAMPALAAGSIVFATSGAVLVLEILAGRLLAQYVGISLATFTGIIGTVLAGISVGTWAGGALADRIRPQRLLGPLISAGGATVLITVPVVRALGPSLPGSSTPAIVVLTTAGFFLPAAVLSAVGPAVVKLQLADLDHTGSVVGRLSAIGTLGALVGTYATGFLLVAAAPTSTIIAVLGTGLVAAGIAVWLWAAAATISAGRAGAVVMVGAVGGLLTIGLDGPCDVESAYHCAEVVPDPSRSSGRLLLLDTARNSYVDLDDPTHLNFSYARVIADVIGTLAPGEPLDALHVGGGGFTLPRWLQATRPGSTSLVLEIDPAVVELGEAELGLVTGPDLDVRTGDARLGVGELADGAYQVVIGDAFTGFSVPWHLTTREFVAEIDRVLAPAGTYLLNVIDHPPLRFVRAETATLLERFEHVAVIAPPARLDGDGGGNFVLVAGHEPLDLAAVSRSIVSRGGRDAIAAGPDADDFAGDREILRDDHAPVDQWRR
ncbi:MAG: fused MFS/spermidine synthase, partial [Acidimicrobiales bacterium]